MQGWTIVSQGQPNHTIAASLIVPAGGFAVLGRGVDQTQNGGVAIDYNYFTGTSATTIFLDATDFLVLRDATGARVDSVRWTNANTMVKGVTRAVRDPLADNSNVDGTNWGYSTVPFGDGDLGTPHLTNGTLDTTPPVIPNSISFTGRLTSDPPLPIGFEDQLFATLRDGSGNTITTTFTWKSETPALATIDANGVMHALAEGTAIFRATAAEGTTATFSLPMAVATASTTAAYGNNTEFGDPTDADATDDFIVRRPQYTTSFNKNRGTPNWVAYDLDAEPVRIERRPLRLLHVRSGAAGELHALHDGLTTPAPVRSPALASIADISPARSIAPPARSTTPRHTTSLTSSRRRRSQSGSMGDPRECPRRSRPQPEQRGLHHRRRGRKQGYGEGRGQNRHSDADVESCRDHATRSGTRERS
jgi:hypothetical protein